MYADLFKWFTNREAGIPAYALVEHDDAGCGDRSAGRQSHPLLRVRAACAQHRPPRAARATPFYMFDQKSFEIDDEGHPWWICPVQSRTIGLFGGTTIERVVHGGRHAQARRRTCAIGDVPQWVDHAYPTDLLLEQYNWCR